MAWWSPPERSDSTHLVSCHHPAHACVMLPSGRSQRFTTHRGVFYEADRARKKMKVKRQASPVRCRGFQMPGFSELIR
eukprot:6174598-Pleurochrysis_carterae.AAC.2